MSGARLYDAPPFRPGDHVFHEPSGETWLVAYADPNSGLMSACGWPDNEAAISDCRLVKAASDKESADLLRGLIATGDRRGRVAARIYARTEPVPLDDGGE